MKIYLWMFYLAACGSASLAQVAPLSTTVVVVGNPEPVTVGESNRSVVVMDTEQTRFAFETVEDYLRTDTSTFIAQRGAGGAQADISIRGTSFEQTLVLLNGLRINDAETSHNNLDLPVPLAAMRAINVLHGAGSTLYGSDAIGGVVDFLTAVPSGNTLRLRSGAGSFGANDQLVIGTLSGRRWTEMLAGERNFSTGFMVDRDYRNESGSSESRYTSAVGVTDILLAGNDRAFGANQFYGNYDSWERTKGWFASMQQELGTKASAAFGYRRHADNFILLRSAPAVYANNHIDQSWQGVVRRKETIGNKTSLFYGLEGDGDSIYSNNLGRHARNWGAGYLDIDLRPSQRISMSAGLREEIIGGGEKVTSPMLAAGYFITQKVKLRGSLGYGFRMPTYLDLYYSDPSTIGNPHLKSESAWNFEVGADWFASRKVYVTSTVFYSRQHDAIDYLRASENDLWQATNLSGLRFTGIEGSMIWQPASSQQIKFGWTALSGAQHALHGYESEYVFNYPVNNASAEWISRFYPGYMLHTRLGVTERYQKDPYAVWDISLARARGRVHPYLQMTNLTNTAYQEVLNVPMPGRAFTGGIELWLGKLPAN